MDTPGSQRVSLWERAGARVQQEWLSAGAPAPSVAGTGPSRSGGACWAWPYRLCVPEEWTLLRLPSRPPGPAELSASTGLCPGVGGASVGPPLPIALRGRYCPLCKAWGTGVTADSGHFSRTLGRHVSLLGWAQIPKRSCRGLG